MTKDNNNGDQNKLQGKIAELGDNVFTHGTKNTSNKFDEIVEEIAHYCGKTLGTDMRNLILGKGKPPVEPAEPKGEGKQPPSEFQMKKWDKDYSQYPKDNKEYKEKAGKVFCKPTRTNELSHED